MALPEIAATVARLDKVVAAARARRQRLGFFAAMYRQVTTTVGREVDAGSFDDNVRMARFVAMFAGRYLDAVAQWESGGQPTRSWRAAFRAAERKDRVIIQHVLLGMNAHINLDLAIVAADICPGDSIIELKDDFGRINDVLQRAMVPLQECIGRFSPLLHVLWAVGGDVDDEVLNFSIRVARAESWQQAVTLAHLDADRRAKAVDSLDRKVSVLARLVTQPGGILERAVDVVAFLESDDVVAVIDALSRVDPGALASGVVTPAPPGAMPAAAGHRGWRSARAAGTGVRMSVMSTRIHDAGRSFIQREGRLLEQRMAAVIFDGAPTAGVVDVLRGYQNPDGGFGHGLEPDKRCPASQAIDVEVALQAMIATGAVDHDMVARACDFLVRIASPDGAVSLATPAIENYPRAEHWSDWTYTPGINPTAGLTGLLHEMGVEHPWATKATEWCWAALEDGISEDAHAVREAFVFLEHVPDRGRADGLAPSVAEYLPQAGHYRSDPDDPAYGVTPLHIAPSPSSRWRGLFPDELVEGHLDRLERDQQPDGGWAITWEPPSAASTLEYRGVMTLWALRVLAAYGR